ncbi:MAG: AMP-binding protein [Pseudomonadota bacterium]|nr:AMP-binding protein [Pseudomonadota bacterium]
MQVSWPLGLPKNRFEIEAIQSDRKRAAVKNALSSPFMSERVSHIDIDNIDDPNEWRKIPVLSKDELRALTTEQFYRDFCIGNAHGAVEFWRSGGATGKPLFYPRSQIDMDYMLGVAFRRIWSCIGAKSSDRVHVSFPMGIHPVGQLTPRSAEREGIGTIWAGAGTTTPSNVQLQLISELCPSIVAAMPSYALHLANIAEIEGIDLASSSVSKLLVSAEPLTKAKREKLERLWGAHVFNSFGMTEGAMTAVERVGIHGGMVAFEDLFYLEVIDSVSGAPVPEGEEGALVMTPLWSNTITPFIRWLTGDIVRMKYPTQNDDPFSVFPVLEHTLRTEGFFKVRGVNINHSDLEDFMFVRREITDFQGEVVGTMGLDQLRILIEVRANEDLAGVINKLLEDIKNKFEVAAEVEILETGTIAKEFEKRVKAPRFVDRRDRL